MTKKDLARALQAAAGGDLSLKRAEELFNAVLDTIKGAVKQSGGVQIKGFGTLKTAVRAPRRVRVGFQKPGTEVKYVDVPAKTTVKFNPDSSW